MSKSAFGNSALRVVEAPPFYTEEVQLWSDDSKEECHSLHSAIPYQESSNPDLPAYFIRKYSKRGEVVLDPFCGGGTTALESILLGRVAYASDISQLATRITSAKITPADITEVTLRLQKANLRRPINLDVYRERFAPFYDVDTFREIANLRAFLHQDFDRVASFVELMMLGLLHGHSAGYLSVYSMTQVSLSPREQEVLNLQRRQTPDYRAAVPRVLRKAASVLRDGCPSVFKLLEKRNKVAQADARNLSYIENAAVDLIVTTPPTPTGKDFPASQVQNQWLRHWFSQAPLAEADVFSVNQLPEWLDYMNEVLLESARVVKSGGRCVLDLKEIMVRGQSGSVMTCLAQKVATLVEENLSRFWEPECVLVNTPRYAKIKNCLKERDPSKTGDRLLVLRRR